MASIDPLLTVPESLTMVTSETIPIDIDTTPLLGAGQSPTSVAYTLFDQTTNPPTPITLDSDPVIDGNQLQLVLSGDDFTAGSNYKLKVTFGVTGVGVWSCYLDIYAPE